MRAVALVALGQLLWSCQAGSFGFPKQAFVKGADNPANSSQSPEPGTGGSTSKTPGEAIQDPFQFCKATRTVDNSGPDGEMDDRRYVGPKIPSSVSRAFSSDNVVWRCMNGHVYGCYLGASGRACQRWSKAKPSPTPSIRKFCATVPDSDVPNAANDTSWSWVCVGKTPVLDKSVAAPILDERGYMVESWKRISR